MSGFYLIHSDIFRLFEFLKIFMLSMKEEENTKQYAYLIVVRTWFLFPFCLEMQN